LTSDLYEPLLERDLDAIPAAARAFADEHSLDELYLAVARFAVLAYAPSMHSQRAVMSCRAVSDFREFDWIVECARYAAMCRQPWSEAPILDSSGDDLPTREELERNAGDDALLMIDTAFALVPILGEKGKAALLRMPMMELEAPQKRSPPMPIETLIDRAIESRGSIESVQAFLVQNRAAISTPTNPSVYHLARDFAQTLLVHVHAPAYRRDEFLAAVKHNLAHGEDFSVWS